MELNTAFDEQIHFNAMQCNGVSTDRQRAGGRQEYVILRTGAAGCGTFIIRLTSAAYP